MPKYYRFRPTSPTRGIKRNKDKEKYKDFIRNELEAESNGLDFVLALSGTPFWYLRRIAWRETHSPLLCVLRQFTSGLQAELQINNRAVFVFKLPTTLRLQDLLDLF